MRAYIFDNEDGHLIERISPKYFHAMTPRNDPQFKVHPYVEIYLHGYPQASQIMAVALTYKELKKLMKP